MKLIFRNSIKMFASCILNKRQINTLKRYYSRLRSLMLNRSIRQHIRPKLNEINASLMANEPSPFQDISYNILEFLNKHKVPGKEFEYRYSENTQQPTLYASVYACMTLSLLGRLNTMQDDQKLKWMEYFNSYQNRDDGLFYDPVVDSTLFRTADWWGARHLALHMISAYTDLGGRPKYQFRFLEKYYNDAQLKSWLDSFDWSKSITHDDDIDNKIMNIGCLLQYQRDIWSDEKAGSAVAYLQKYLMNKINPETGMWGRFDTHDPEQRSRMVQFAYHLFPLFFYDNIQIKHTDKIIQLVMATQNELGGFGVKLNSSACEDIDSIDILIRLSPLVPDRKKEIDAALKKALGWVLCNQVDDGGFVFRLNEPFVYGHPETSSKANQGAMFPTWFRTLCLAYIMNYLDISNEFIITRAPGYEL